MNSKELQKQALDLGLIRISYQWDDNHKAYEMYYKEKKSITDIMYYFMDKKKKKSYTRVRVAISNHKTKLDYLSRAGFVLEN